MRIPAIPALACGLTIATVLTVPATTRPSAAAGAPAGAKASPLRTSWGAPDLQGIWTGSTLTPLERPAEFAGREFLTEAEARAIEARALSGRTDAPPRPGDPGTYNQVWFDPSATVLPSRRTSLIIDPPDGRIPFTPEGRRHTTVSAARYGKGPFDSHLDLDTGERCLTDGVPIWFNGYNNNYQIFQTPEHVAIVHELYREYRVIPLTDQPHGTVPQWQGDARGRWEGSTLVVDTTRFADKAAYLWTTAWRASRPTLHLVERFTRVDAETIEYQFTMDDPAMFTRPWTAAFPLTTNQAARGVTEGPLYEYACHEGNYAAVNVLSGARLQERGADAGRGSSSTR